MYTGLFLLYHCGCTKIAVDFDVNLNVIKNRDNSRSTHHYQLKGFINNRLFLGRGRGVF